MTVDAAKLRRDLLAVVRGRGGARHGAVAEALLAVPRHVFVPEVAVAKAYRDEAIVTKRDGDGVPVSSSSQPTIMALMLDQLGVAAGQRVLEIGAGTGYNAALLAHIVGPAGVVVTVDIDGQMVDRARSRLAVAGYPQVTVACGDGAEGYPAAAPFDRIIATAGVWDLAPAWLEQLAPGGRIVVPLDLHGAQVSVAFEGENGHWVGRDPVACGFMRLRGGFAGPGRVHVLDPATRLRLAVPDDREIDAGAVGRAVAGAAVVRPTGVQGLRPDDSFGLGLWLVITEPRSCALSDEGHGSSVLEPGLVRSTDFRLTIGILEATSIAVLGLHSDPEALAVQAHGYGPDGDRLATSLAEHVRAWDAAGRPHVGQLRIAAYPVSAYPADLPGPDDGIVLTKVHTRLVIAVRS
ncbi:MAG: methyltransferase, FxLD system [Micromonosporaceae bacterium]